MKWISQLISRVAVQANFTVQAKAATGMSPLDSNTLLTIFGGKNEGETVEKTVLRLFFAKNTSRHHNLQ